MTARREYEMTEADLSPCPWCDPAASTNLPHLHELPPDRGPCKWQVMCLGCCAAGPTGFTPGDAVKFWNHRRVPKQAGVDAAEEQGERERSDRSELTEASRPWCLDTCAAIVEAASIAAAVEEVRAAGPQKTRPLGEFIAEQRTGWRDMESAPKDGTPILAHCRPCFFDSGKPMGFTYQAVVWWRGEYMKTKYGETLWPWRLNHGDSAVEPTHWQPLPAPPEGKETP